MTNSGNFCYKLRQIIYCKTETFITKRGKYYKQSNFNTNTTGFSIQGVYYTTWYSSIFSNFDNTFEKVYQYKTGL